MSKKIDYRYKACGLDNVIIVDMPVVEDDSGEMVIGIPNIKGLHMVLAHCIIVQPSALRGADIRFLRTEIGMTQAQLAEILHKDTQSVGRWERGECPVDQTAEILIRKLVTEKLQLETRLTVEELSKFSFQASEATCIEIDGSRPGDYKPIAA